MFARAGGDRERTAANEAVVSQWRAMSSRLKMRASAYGVELKRPSGPAARETSSSVAKIGALGGDSPAKRRRPGSDKLVKKLTSMARIGAAGSGTPGAGGKKQNDEFLAFVLSSMARNREILGDAELPPSPNFVPRQEMPKTEEEVMKEFDFYAKGDHVSFACPKMVVDSVLAYGSGILVAGVTMYGLSSLVPAFKNKTLTSLFDTHKFNMACKIVFYAAGLIEGTLTSKQVLKEATVGLLAKITTGFIKGGVSWLLGGFILNPVGAIIAVVLVSVAGSFAEMQIKSLLFKDEETVIEAFVEEEAVNKMMMEEYDSQVQILANGGKPWQFGRALSDYLWVHKKAVADMATIGCCAAASGALLSATPHFAITKEIITQFNDSILIRTIAIPRVIKILSDAASDSWAQGFVESLWTEKMPQEARHHIERIGKAVNARAVASSILHELLFMGYKYYSTAPAAELPIDGLAVAAPAEAGGPAATTAASPEDGDKKPGSGGILEAELGGPPGDSYVPSEDVEQVAEMVAQSKGDIGAARERLLYASIMEKKSAKQLTEAEILVVGGTTLITADRAEMQPLLEKWQAAHKDMPKAARGNLEAVKKAYASAMKHLRSIFLLDFKTSARKAEPPVPAADGRQALLDVVIGPQELGTTPAERGPFDPAALTTLYKNYRPPTLAVQGPAQRPGTTPAASPFGVEEAERQQMTPWEQGRAAAAKADLAKAMKKMRGEKLVNEIRKAVNLVTGQGLTVSHIVQYLTGSREQLSKIVLGTPEFKQDMQFAFEQAGATMAQGMEQLRANPPSEPAAGPFHIPCLHWPDEFSPVLQADGSWRSVSASGEMLGSNCVSGPPYLKVIKGLHMLAQSAVSVASKMSMETEAIMNIDGNIFWDEGVAPLNKEVLKNYIEKAEYAANTGILRRVLDAAGDAKNSVVGLFTRNAPAAIKFGIEAAHTAELAANPALLYVSIAEDALVRSTIRSTEATMLKSPPGSGEADTANVLKHVMCYLYPNAGGCDKVTVGIELQDYAAVSLSAALSPEVRASFAGLSNFKGSMLSNVTNFIKIIATLNLPPDVKARLLVGGPATSTGYEAAVRFFSKSWSETGTDLHKIITAGLHDERTLRGFTGGVAEVAAVGILDFLTEGHGSQIYAFARPFVLRGAAYIEKTYLAV